MTDISIADQIAAVRDAAVLCESRTLAALHLLSPPLRAAIATLERYERAMAVVKASRDLVENRASSNPCWLTALYEQVAAYDAADKG